VPGTWRGRRRLPAGTGVRLAPHRGTTSLAVPRAPTGTTCTTASFPAVTGCPVRFYWGPATAQVRRLVRFFRRLTGDGRVDAFAPGSVVGGTHPEPVHRRSRRRRPPHTRRWN